MSSHGPVGVYGLEVNSELPTHANEAMAPLDISITMAAIDPTEEIDDDGNPARATLVMMRVMPDPEEGSDDEDDDEDDDVRAIENRLRQAIPGLLDEYEQQSSDEDVEESDEDGHSDGNPIKIQAETRGDLFKALKAYSEQAAAAKGGDSADSKKSKSQKSEPEPADESSDDSDDASESSDSDEGYDEFVICTLDRRTCQQPLNITISAQEQVFFRVKGNLTVNLTGNYLIPRSLEDQEDSEDDSDDEDPLGILRGMDVDSEDESEDELDDTDEEPRIVELKETKPEKGKKRAADETTAAVTEKKQKTFEVEAAAKKADKKEQKKDKKQDKKQPEPEQKKEEPKDKKKEKKQAKAEAEVPEEQPSGKDQSSRVVKGVKVEDKKTGEGAVAKVGSRVDVRYIGKLTNGQKFDSNTKGKPFSFNLGKGEVIQGWDIGVAGMKPGGERRLTVPAHLAYGKRALPGIPSNSTLVFEVKLIKIH